LGRTLETMVRLTRKERTAPTQEERRSPMEPSGAKATTRARRERPPTEVSMSTRWGRRREMSVAVDTELAAETATDTTRTGRRVQGCVALRFCSVERTNAHQTQPVSSPVSSGISKEVLTNERGCSEEARNLIVISGRPKPDIVPRRGISVMMAATDPTELGVWSRAETTQNKKPRKAARRVFMTKATEFLANWGL
jgi:hypothetical protein